MESQESTFRQPIVDAPDRRHVFQPRLGSITKNTLVGSRQVCFSTYVR
jgi:hypothetical protein